MQKVVYKYGLHPHEINWIDMPKGAEVLSCQFLPWEGEVYVYALVDPDEVFTEKRKFTVVGTGAPPVDTEKNKGYVGSFRIDEENLIFHVFELAWP